MLPLRHSAFPRSLLTSIALHAGALACGVLVVRTWVVSDAGAPERATLTVESPREDEAPSPEPEHVAEVQEPELREPELRPVRPRWTDAELRAPEESFESLPDPSAALARVSATVFARRPPAAQRDEPASTELEPEPAVAEPPVATTAAPPTAGAVAVAARPTERPEPPYPPLSVRLGEAGIVRCRLHVDAAGHVTKVELVRSSGHARLDDSALETLATWRFAPATRDGVAHATVVEHDVEFRIDS